MKKSVAKVLLVFIAVVLLLTGSVLKGSDNSPLTLKAEAAINWGTGVYISSYGQVVNSITYKGTTVNAVYAPRNQVSGYDSDPTFCCAAFVSKFYRQVFGIGVNNLYPGSTPNVYSGGGYFYKTTTPVVGDIAGSNEHWAIVKEVSGNTITLIEQNAWKDNAHTTAAVNRKLILPESSYWFWHYSGNTTTTWKETTPKTDLGTNFYAAIFNTERNKALTAESNDNVAMYTYKGTANQVWHFEKLSTGSYKITNCSNGKALDLSGGATSGWANVQVYASNDTGAQKWSFYGSSPNMFVSADCNLGVLDVADAKYTDGTNITVNTKTGHNAQLFKIVKEAVPSAATLSVATTGTTVKFSWNSTSSTKNYELKIYDGSNLYKTVSSLTSTNYSINLPAGSYSAVLTSKNTFASSASNKVSFTVAGTSSSGDWTYSNTLPSSVNSKNYVIEYRHTYEKVAKTSPGTGWVKGAAAKQVYENSGSVYSSTLPLATSSTRALVDYGYYHYCSGSKGNEVNYAATSTFPHYDGIDKNNVTEFYSHADYADSRYTFYGLKYKSNGNYVYCHSGTTCDGSFGSHGNRSYYWYKVYYYQDKVPVTHYKFTKTGNWTSTKDATATSFTVRYKPIAVKKPGTTSKITATKGTKTTTLTWNKVTGASGYRVYYKSGNKWVALTDTTANTCKITNLVPGTKHTFAVRAYTKANGTTLWADSYKTINVTTKLGTPSGLKASSQTSKTITLSWKKVEGATGYRIYKYDSKSKKYKSVVTIKNGSTVKYKITELKAGTTYKFKVKAYKKLSDGSTLWSEATKVFTTATKPATVTLSKVTAGSKKATVNWKTVTGATGYEIVYSTSKDFKKSKKTTTIKKQSTKKTTIKKLTKGKKYYFKVRAYKTVDGKKIYGAYSSVKSVKIK